MTPQEAEDVLYETVLTKVYKSQHWMKATHILPTNFIIFCWVPPLTTGTWDKCGDRVDLLMEKLRAEGWPFYVKLLLALVGCLGPVGPPGQVEACMAEAERVS